MIEDTRPDTRWYVAMAGEEGACFLLAPGAGIEAADSIDTAANFATAADARADMTARTRGPGNLLFVFSYNPADTVG